MKFIRFVIKFLMVIVTIAWPLLIIAGAPVLIREPGVIDASVIQSFEVATALWFIVMAFLSVIYFAIRGDAKAR